MTPEQLARELAWLARLSRGVRRVTSAATLERAGLVALAVLGAACVYATIVQRVAEEMAR